MEKHENEMAMEALKWIVSTIADNDEEAQQEAANENDLIAQGRAEAYWEVMDIIQSRLEILGICLDNEGFEK